MTVADNQLEKENFKQHILDSSRQNWFLGRELARVPIFHSTDTSFADRARAIVQKGSNKDNAITQELCAAYQDQVVNKAKSGSE